ncbi:MAG: PKD domain-containing protein [Bacteroidales bacterium]|nr:PKD domain-containing protein [Bacteroidales bacterium]
MRNLLTITLIIAAIVSCGRQPEVKVSAAFATNTDVLLVGEELLITNMSTVENDILAFCKWEYGNMEAGYQNYYGLEFEGLSFDAPGMYTLTLTAYAEQGAGEDSYTRQILVVEENDIPWADFDCPSVAKVGEEVLFEDKSVDNIGGIKTWSWDIGGVASSFDSPVIVFDTPAAGVKVTLTVTDAFGASGSVTKYIDITV